MKIEEVEKGTKQEKGTSRKKGMQENEQAGRRKRNAGRRKKKKKKKGKKTQFSGVVKAATSEKFLRWRFLPPQKFFSVVGEITTSEMGKFSVSKLFCRLFSARQKNFCRSKNCHDRKFSVVLKSETTGKNFCRGNF